MQELNRQLSTINHVVVHPKYHSIGLGAKLIRETLPLAGTPYAEMIAVMAKYRPFAEKAGMRKVAERPPQLCWASSQASRKGLKRRKRPSGTLSFI
jgi:ABC-type ATPase with predicted acetyltransferase domain